MTSRSISLSFPNFNFASTEKAEEGGGGGRRRESGFELGDMLL